MKRRITVVLIVSGLCMLAIGEAPRYLEELRIGGGFGDTVDGGADFDKAGNISTDGDVACDAATVDGQVTAASGVFSQMAARDLLEAGQDDLTAGNLHIYGSNNTTSGALYLHAPDAYDSAVDYWKFSSGLLGTLQLTGSGGTYNPGTVLQFSAVSGVLSTTYDLAVSGGSVEVGRAGVEAAQGVVSVYASDAGTAPGCVTLYSCDGTPRYVFASNDGSGLRISGSAPTSDTAGAWLTSGKFKGADSTTDAVDLATSEVAGLLPTNKIASGLTDAQINDAITVWSGSIDSTPVGATTASTGRFTSLTTSGVILDTTITTWPADTASPSVEGGNVFKVPNTWTTGNNITGLTGGTLGQRILIIGGDCDCLVQDVGALRLAGSWTACASDTLQLFYDGTAWYEVCRSNN